MLRFLALLLAFSMTAIPAYAMHPNGCPDYIPPNVVINPLDAPPKLDETLNLASIRLMALDHKKDLSGAQHDTPVALTAASLQLGSHFEITVRGRSDDPLVCAQIKSFKLDFGFNDTTVYMARELERGTCAYDTVLDHERRHIATDRLLVQSIAPNLETQLRDAIASIGVIRASSGQVAQTQIHRMLQDYLRALGASLSQVRQKHQSMIDTDDEYERLSRSCDGALGALIKRN